MQLGSENIALKKANNNHCHKQVFCYVHVTGVLLRICNRCLVTYMYTAGSIPQTHNTHYCTILRSYCVFYPFLKPSDGGLTRCVVTKSNFHMCCILSFQNYPSVDYTTITYVIKYLKNVIINTATTRKVSEMPYPTL